MIAIVGYSVMIKPFNRIFKQIEFFQPMRKKLMIYFSIFIGTLMMREVVMIVYICLGKKIIESTFDNFPWYEKLLIFLTEIGPVGIIFYGIYLASGSAKKTDKGSV